MWGNGALFRKKLQLQPPGSIGQRPALSAALCCFRPLSGAAVLSVIHSRLAREGGAGKIPGPQGEDIG